MRISFCTTCANRLSQLEQTFEANLAVIAKHPTVEWVIVNLGSRDALHEFMMRRLPALPSNVRYLRRLESQPWHMSKSKNIAHQAGTGDVLFNLDCDNFIGNAVEIVAEAFGRGVGGLHLWSGSFGDGTCGRVAVRRDLFYQYGGYDEALLPITYEDKDLLNRFRKAGVAVDHITCRPNSAIVNTREEALASCAINGLSWIECNRVNQRRSEDNLEAGKLVANDGREWGKAELVRYERNGDQQALMPRGDHRRAVPALSSPGLRVALGANLFKVRSSVTAPDREQRTGHRGRVVWFTGLSGAGKSTIALELERRLFAAGRFVYLLDGDNLRRGLCSDLGFSETDRSENIRRAAEVARVLADAGLICLAAFISPLHSDRENARKRFSAGQFIEVFVDAPIDVCRQRDPKGLYRRADRGEIPNFTGVGAPYEIPRNAELVLRTGETSVSECVNQVYEYLLAMEPATAEMAL
jgi:adenylyl-sulfate kinase